MEDKKMKKKIFTVSVIAIVAVMLMMLLVACVPSAEKAKENLEEAGYVVVLKENVSDDCEAVLSATKVSIGTAGVGGEHVTIYYYKDSATAKEKLAEIEKLAGEDAVEISGKVIYYGTEQAIKDMK